MNLKSVLVLLSSGFLLCNDCAAHNEFQVGLAKVDITPGEPIILAGYGGRTQAFERIDTKLWARALAIGGETPHVVISVDNCGVPAHMVEAVYADVTKAHRVERAAFVICSTHTHNAPALPGYATVLWQERVGKKEFDAANRYAKQLHEKLVALAKKALTNQVRATLHWGQGEVTFGGNRRVVNKKRWQGFGFQYEAPVDHSLPFLVAKDPTGNVIGVWTNYACHCTTVGSANIIGGDWAGFANEEIEKSYPGAVALTTIGCGADVGPQPSGSSALAQKHGAAIATEIEHVLAEKTGDSLVGVSPINSRVASKDVTIKLPFADVHDTAHWESRAKLSGFDGVHGREMLRQLKTNGAIKPELEYRIASWQFGDELALVFLPGEVCVDYAVRLKSENDWKRLWINGWSNDVPCYIPSRRVLLEGGYEADFSMIYYARPGRFADSVEEEIVGAVNSLLPKTFRGSDATKDRPGIFEQPDPSIVTMQQFKRAVTAFDGNDAKLLARIKTLASGATSGFDEVVHQDFADVSWFDFYGRRKNKRPFVRQLKANDRLDWRTPILERPEKESLVLCFCGGIGWRSQPKTGGFVLRLGDAMLNFDVTDGISRWSHVEERLELFYLPTWRSGEDTAGFFLLLIKDSKLVHDGAPAVLSVTSLGSGSNRWFALDKLNDSAKTLRSVLRGL